MRKGGPPCNAYSGMSTAMSCYYILGGVSHGPAGAQDGSDVVRTELSSA